MSDSVNKIKSWLWAQTDSSWGFSPCDHLFIFFMSFFISSARAAEAVRQVVNWDQSGTSSNRAGLWLTWPLTLSAERLSLENAGGDQQLLSLQQWDLRQWDLCQRPQAAALCPWALQVLLPMPLQTLQPEDTHEKVSAPEPRTLLQQINLFPVSLSSHAF